MAAARSTTSVKYLPAAEPLTIGGSPSDRRTAPTSCATAIGSISGSAPGLDHTSIGAGRRCCGRRLLELLWLLLLLRRAPRLIRHHPPATRPGVDPGRDEVGRC